jgi:uncharacterized protein YgiM (DUF1202 family)
MKFLALLFAFLINSLSTYSLADEQNLPYEFYVDQNYYTLCDSVNLRSEADLSSKTISQLPIGTKLLILEKTEQLTNLNGAEFFWYKVQTEKKTTGYGVENWLCNRFEVQKTQISFSIMALRK